MWAQRDVGTKRRGHKIPLFEAQRDVGTKYHFFGHIETWAQRDVGTKRCFVSKNVSKPKTFVAADTIYSQQFAGHDTIASTSTNREWCISSMIYSRDTPFWSVTLEMQTSFAGYFYIISRS